MKYVDDLEELETVYVVPHAGTWIEISIINHYKIPTLVVPHAGTWIEMFFVLSCGYATYKSFPTRERGLKSAKQGLQIQPQKVVPHAGTWIEI